MLVSKTAKEIEEWITSYIYDNAEHLNFSSEVDVTAGLEYHGFDSMEAQSMLGELMEWLDLGSDDIDATFFYDYPTIEQFAEAVSKL